MQITKQHNNQSTGHADPEEQDHPFNTVLIVDDSLAERFRMQLMLENFGYNVITADCGQQALQIIKAQPIHLILSDWQMPGLSGIELCRLVRSDSSIERPYFIMVTGRNSNADLIEGMDGGADDFIAKPFDQEELRVRTQAGVRLLELHAETKQRGVLLLDALRREEKTNRMIREDLVVAARMQLDTLPANGSPFPHADIATLFHAASQVGGDSYNYFRLDERHLAFYLIDVVGHGIASAMQSFSISHFISPETGVVTLCSSTRPSDGEKIRALPSNIVPPDEVVSTLNIRFLDRSDDCKQYFTMVYGVLDVESGTGELCQAGHPHPFILGKDSSVRSLGQGGLPVGMFEGAEFESVEFHLDLDERLILHSDGVTDCCNESNTPFGARRLEELLSQFQNKSIVDGIKLLDQSLMRWQGKEQYADDISLLAITLLEGQRSNTENVI